MVTKLDGTIGGLFRGLRVVLFLMVTKLLRAVSNAFEGLRVVLFLMVTKLFPLKLVSGALFESCVVSDGNQTSLAR